MKAVVWTAYGPPEVLRVEDVEKPVPKKNEVLIRVYATTVTGTDPMMRMGKSLPARLLIGIRRPNRSHRIPGLELAGEIEAVGQSVKRFKAGDQVFGFTGFGLGACAEYKCMPDTAPLAKKPPGVSYAEAAAAVDGASTALFFLKNKGRIVRGQRVLIHGASGSIGTFAVQLAKYFGAEVTGVCSTGNVGLVKALGAASVIDYTTTDFTKNGEVYDLIFDTVGKTSFRRCRGSLTKSGRYVGTVMGLGPIVQTLWTAVTGGKRAVFALSVEKSAEMALLRDLLESGEVRSVIDRQYSLDQIVEAHRYVEKGHKKGNVIVTL